MAVAIILLLPGEPETPTPPAASMAAPAAAPVPYSPPAPPLAGDTSGLQLRGVLGYAGGGGTAIFGLPDGRQRLVTLGREVVPGVRLEALGLDRATVHDGVQRVDFVLPEMRQAEGGGAMPVPAAIATPAPALPPASDAQRTINDFRLGLKAERSGDRIRGYRIAPGASLPLLTQAGLRPGDVILAVNGVEITDEERLIELPAALATASSIEIDYERGGSRAKATVPAQR